MAGLVLCAIDPHAALKFTGNRDDAESFTSRLSRLQSQYVMANQHADHRAALTGTDDIGVCHGARVELF